MPKLNAPRYTFAVPDHWLSGPPARGDAQLAITVPARREQDLRSTVESVALAAEAAQIPTSLIVCVNDSQDADPKLVMQYENAARELIKWTGQQNWPHVELAVCAARMPVRHAGVGLARKIAMDAAWRSFSEHGSLTAPIVCLDADCLVDESYVGTIVDWFSRNPGAPGAAIYFEHNLDELDDSVRSRISQYELFLRYYVAGLRWAGYPWAFHTVGSAMAVRAGVYLEQGGMNRRKGAEDFYFLQKVMLLGGFGNISGTCVFPSARESRRVPFGTGRAMSDLAVGDGVWPAYAPDVFADISALLRVVTTWHTEFNCEGLGEGVLAFLEEQEIAIRLEEIRSNVATEHGFRHRIMQWLKPFTVRKLVHFLRDNYYESQPVEIAAVDLLERMSLPVPNSDSADRLLAIYRGLDRNSG